MSIFMPLEDRFLMSCQIHPAGFTMGPKIRNQSKSRLAHYPWIAEWWVYVILRHNFC